MEDQSEIVFVCIYLEDQSNKFNVVKCCIVQTKEQQSLIPLIIVDMTSDVRNLYKIWKQYNYNDEADLLERFPSLNLRAMKRWIIQKHKIIKKTRILLQNIDKQHIVKYRPPIKKKSSTMSIPEEQSYIYPESNKNIVLYDFKQKKLPKFPMSNKSSDNIISYQTHRASKSLLIGDKFTIEQYI